VNEEWKEIIGYEGLYLISNLGRCKSLGINKSNRWKTERLLKPSKNCEYYSYVLYKNQKAKYYLIHRLLALHFIPNIQNKPEVNHINGIKSDNRIENLEWVTRSENNKHGFDIGLHKSPKGENHYLASLSNTQASEIRKKYIPFVYSQNMLAREYNTDQSIIWNIIHNKSYTE